MPSGSRLGEPRHDRRYLAQQAQGRARQTIVDSLVAAITLQRLTFAPHLAEEKAMRASLGRFHRELDDAGLIGDALVSALAVAVHERVKTPPRVW